MANKEGKRIMLWARLMRYTDQIPAPEGLPGNCYMYNGPTNGGWGGCVYGKITIRKDGKPTGVSTHRLSYETFKRKLAAGFEAGHKCHRSLCWNPEHIQGIKHTTNIKQREARRAKGA